METVPWAAHADHDMHVDGRRSRSHSEDDLVVSWDGNNDGGGDRAAKRRRLSARSTSPTSLADLPAEMRAAILLHLDRAVDYVACMAASPILRDACLPNMWIHRRALLYSSEPDRAFLSDECVAVVREVWTQWGAARLGSRDDAHQDRLCGPSRLWGARCRCWQYRTLKEALERGRRSTVVFLCDTVLEVHKSRPSTMEPCDNNYSNTVANSACHGDSAGGRRGANNHGINCGQASPIRRRPLHRAMVKSAAAGALASSRPDDGLFLLGILARSAQRRATIGDHVKERAVRLMMNLMTEEVRSIIRALPALVRKPMLDAIARDAIGYGCCDLALMAHEEGADDRLPGMLCEIVGDIQAVDYFAPLWCRAVAAGHAPEILWKRVIDALPPQVLAHCPSVLGAILSIHPYPRNKGLLCAKAIRQGNTSSVETIRVHGAGDFECPDVRAAIADACDADNVEMVAYIVKEACDIDGRLLLARTCRRRSPRVSAFLARHVSDSGSSDE